jgi:hypothetical protein
MSRIQAADIRAVRTVKDEVNYTHLARANANRTCVPFCPSGRIIDHTVITFLGIFCIWKKNFDTLCSGFFKGLQILPQIYLYLNYPLVKS